MRHRAIGLIRASAGPVRYGLLQRVMPGWIEASGPSVPVGALCRVEHPAFADGLTAEVIRVEDGAIALAPFGDCRGLVAGARVVAVESADRLPVGHGFLGRAVDSFGAPIDGGPAILADALVPLNPDPPPPLARETDTEILETGIRAIDGLLTLSRGQRLGIFAASGVGKTTLVSQLVRQVDADVCIACLVGERGREVEAIWATDLAGAARRRSVLVAATSDQAAALRVRAVYQALALARHWRDQGLSVLLVLDSVTRFAMALREIGLAAGEPPTVRAYTPNVFAAVPRIVEQCGAVKSGGSISAVMTILAETDDVDDPLSELMKSLLDGHIVLSRTLSEQGHFPAIDPLRSVSRNRPGLRSKRHQALARGAVAHLSRFESSRAMIEAGLHLPGSDAAIDAAIAARPALNALLQQPSDQRCDLDETLRLLDEVLGGNHGATA